ncbi:MAG: tetratricopeptide repeat protein [Phycisphaerae bacterium]|nr:tetratricopeptide repeat protein [Phycisphaerae bacterium]
MDTQRWARLEDLFDRASGLPSEEWEPLAAREARDDTTLRGELLSLLRAGAGSGFDLDRPAADAGRLIERLDSGSSGESPPDALVGQMLGNYRVDRVIGAGGMGVVYEARQEVPRRRVALKVIRFGGAGPTAQKRFAFEAEALGRLEHAGIARVYEFGRAETPLGPLPFLAMEYVEGETIVAHAARARLGTRARLELVARVCDAVQYAHQRGVIHRDLKPGNILVTAEGQPKVLDFGVARLTDDQSRGATLQTYTGQLVGTVPYMSPEQATGQSRGLDTRADVYSLGVILYELLAGRLPHDLRGKPVTEALRVITEQDHTRLSVVDRGLRGDVETIVGKALEKERERRYQSAGDLAADIRRFLDNRAIAARPASTAYQLRKFARRNKVLVGGVAAALVLLSAGVIGTSIGLVRAMSAEERAIGEADRARRQALKATHVAKVLEDLLAAANPFESEGEDPRVSELLAAAEGTIERLQDEPDVQWSLLRTLAKANRAIGKTDKALAQIDAALAVLARHQPEGGYETAITLQSKAAIVQERGGRAEALDLAQRSLEMVERSQGAESVEAADQMAAVGVYLTRVGRHEEAERVLRRSVALLRERTGDADSRLGEALGDLGAALKARGDYAGAVLAMREGVEVLRRALGPRSPSLALHLSNFGRMLQQEGNYAEAEPLLHEALDIRRLVLGAEHPHVVNSEVNLSLLQMDLGQSAGAESAIRRSVDTLRRVQGPEHLDTADALNALGRVEMEKRRYAEAAEVYRESLRIRLAALGERHSLVALSMVNLGNALVRAGNLAEGVPLVERGVAIRRQVSGPQHSMTATSLRALAIARLAQSRPAEALALLDESASILSKRIAKDHPVLLGVRIDHAVALRMVGRADQAETELREVIDALAARGDAGRRELGRACFEHGQLLAARGDAEGSRAAFIRAIDIRAGLHDDAGVLEVRHAMGAAPDTGATNEPGGGP